MLGEYDSAMSPTNDASSMMAWGFPLELISSSASVGHPSDEDASSSFDPPEEKASWKTPAKKSVLAGLMQGPAHRSTNTALLLVAGSVVCNKERGLASAAIAASDYPRSVLVWPRNSNSNRKKNSPLPAYEPPLLNSSATPRTSATDWLELHMEPSSERIRAK